MMTRAPSTSATKERRASARRASVWVGLFCLSVQLGTALHLLLADHIRCAEHGELIHADVDHHEHHGSAFPEMPSSEPTVRASDRHADHGHEHCLIGTEPRNLALQPPVLIELRAPQGLPAVPLLPGRGAVAPSHRIYALAPKASPPV